eukprot:s3645_g7.t2
MEEEPLVKGKSTLLVDEDAQDLEESDDSYFENFLAEVDGMDGRVGKGETQEQTQFSVEIRRERWQPRRTAEHSDEIVVVGGCPSKAVTFVYYYGHGDDAAGSSTFVGLASVSPRRDDASADQEAPEQECGAVVLDLALHLCGAEKEPGAATGAFINMRPNVVEHQELGARESMQRLRSGHRTVDIGSWNGGTYFHLVTSIVLQGMLFNYLEQGARVSMCMVQLLKSLVLALRASVRSLLRVSVASMIVVKALVLLNRCEVVPKMKVKDKAEQQEDSREIIQALKSHLVESNQQLMSGIAERNRQQVLEYVKNRFSTAISRDQAPIKAVLPSVERAAAGPPLQPEGITGSTPIAFGGGAVMSEKHLRDLRQQDPAALSY